MTLYSQKSYTGFTLVEVMIASLLFTVVMLLGMETLLSVTRSHHQTQAIHQSLDAVSFALEDMARNIRLGTTFSCGGIGTLNQNCVSPTNQYDAYGKKLTFEPFNGDIGNPNDDVSYWIAPTGAGANAPYSLFKSITGDSGANMDARYASITPPNILIDETKSGFTVLDAYPALTIAGAPHDTTQVHIVIRLAGIIQYRDIAVPFDVQTTITPRQPDL